MCALDLYNWYESRYPHDFKQLIKLKHYNIMDLSFTLNQVWDGLDPAEKLLMCAVYNDDINLARQLINSKRANPFFGKRYMTLFNKNLHSNRSSLNLTDYEDFHKDLFNIDQSVFMESNPHQLRRRFSCDLFINGENNCCCQSIDKCSVSTNMCDMSPFYFAIKLDNYRLCELFIENLKANSLPTFILNANRQLLRFSTNSLHMPCSKLVHLNSVLSNSELTKLLCIALSNRNFKIATLILSNVSNSKQILNFQNLSESFIYNEHFCLYLIQALIVDAKTLLKEAISRHATETTYFLINHMENTESRAYLISLYKSLLHTTVVIGDINIFKMFLVKLNRLDLKNDQIKELFVHKLIRSNYHYVLERLKLASSELNLRDGEETQQLATLKGIDFDQYLKMDNKELFANTYTVVMSRFNRLKLLKLLFSESYSKENLTSGSIEENLASFWTELEAKTKTTISSYDRIFAATEYKENPSETDKSLIQRAKNHSKRFYLGRYLVYAESEPFLVKELLKESYEVTNLDLVQAAKSEISELTLHYLMQTLDKLSAKQMGPVDYVSGNFLEIVFCRMVRCRQMDRVAKLERLLFEAVVLKNAKMTCSFNLLNLFVTEDNFVRERFYVKYFSILFYLNRSFRIFPESHLKRFNALVDWFLKSHFSYKCAKNSAQVDLAILGLCQESQSPRDFSLKELARSSCLNNSYSQGYERIIDRFNDSTRHFIFFVNEMKKILSC